MTDPAAWARESRELFSAARDPRGLQVAVVTLHRRVDDMVQASLAGHSVRVDCGRGCSYCCHMPVHVAPYEAFALAAWLRRTADPPRVARVIERLRDNAVRTRDLGAEGRRRANLPCALLGEDGACTAYEARPAHCRRFHSTRVETCKASFDDPADDTIEAPMHPAVAHNVAVVMSLAQQAARAAALDAETVDMNLALLDALENPKSLRRWRDGKKPFAGAAA
jgi:hypothetical protein